jgi:hypothetical protein
MTHNTPHETDRDLRWCEHCQLSVGPSQNDGTPRCSACGADF